MRLTRPWQTRVPLAALGVTAAAGVAAVLWSLDTGEEPRPRAEPVTLTAASPNDRTAPEPRVTSPATLAATLRASRSAPSPELLRNNPQAQAAYDASARPGDFVTPPSVSVEH